MIEPSQGRKLGREGRRAVAMPRHLTWAGRQQGAWKNGECIPRNGKPFSQTAQETVSSCRMPGQSGRLAPRPRTVPAREKFRSSDSSLFDPFLLCPTGYPAPPFLLLGRERRSTDNNIRAACCKGRRDDRGASKVDGRIQRAFSIFHRCCHDHNQFTSKTGGIELFNEDGARISHIP